MTRYGQLALGQHLLFPGQQAFVLSGGLFNGGVDEHLHLVELVHADDAAGVLAVRAGFAPVAGALAGEPDGTRREVQDFVRVVPGQRHLGGSHEVKVILGETVDLGVVLYVKTGALHGLGAHQGGRDHGDETGLDGLIHGHLQQRHLQPRAHAAQEVEAGAGHLRAALHVDRADQLTDFQVVLAARNRGIRGACRRS